MPPGSARNASARASISALRSRMRVDDEQLVGVVVGPLALHQRLRDHADRARAARPGRGGDRAHHRHCARRRTPASQPRAAIPRPTSAASVDVVRRDAVGGRAVDADRRPHGQCASSHAR